MPLDLNFYKGKRVLLTGHTGFKGTWMSRVLMTAGAELVGYSRCTPKDPSFFAMADVEQGMTSIAGDVCDLPHLLDVFQRCQPEIVIHMAAQPIVRESYRDPVQTYSTNVMGTVNLMECVRLTPSVHSVINVTTDKVYDNKERPEGYREEEPLDGYDPYSNSKSCSELVTHSYVRSFFQHRENLAVSTCRAGNVIGGGDFAADRIIPDCVRAVQAGVPIAVRNPYSIRPYQHVLDPVMAYLLLAQKQYENPALQGTYNIGPDDVDCVTTGELVSMFCAAWGRGASWSNQAEPNAPHEAAFLKLENRKFRSMLSWSPRWNISEAINRVCAWSHTWLDDGDIPTEMDREVRAFLK